MIAGRRGGECRGHPANERSFETTTGGLGPKVTRMESAGGGWVSKKRCECLLKGGKTIVKGSERAAGPKIRRGGGERKR